MIWSRTFTDTPRSYAPQNEVGTLLSSRISCFCSARYCGVLPRFRRHRRQDANAVLLRRYLGRLWLVGGIPRCWPRHWKNTTAVIKVDCNVELNPCKWSPQSRVDSFVNDIVGRTSALSEGVVTNLLVFARDCLSLQVSVRICAYLENLCSGMDSDLCETE